MRFLFDEARTAQAAACLVSLNGGRMNYMVLIKLLYLSDRQSLIETGLPITGDRMVSMPHGPVLSATLDLIKEPEPEPGIHSPWHEYLLTRPAPREVKLKLSDPDEDELSRYHLKVLKGVYCEFGKKGKYELRDWTHQLPEWEDPKGSSRTIDPRRILEKAGVPRSRIDDFERDADEDWFVRSLERGLA